ASTDFVSLSPNTINPRRTRQESFVSDGNATPTTSSLSTITETFTVLGLLPFISQTSTRWMPIILRIHYPRSGNQKVLVLILNFIPSLVFAGSERTRFALQRPPIRSHF